MYKPFFNFNTEPFSIAPDPHFIYMSEHHQEGLAHLLYGLNKGGGFVALTGEVGTGKTTLCHCLLQQLPENIDIALVLNPKLNALELLATICDELHISYNEDNPTLKGLVDGLNRHLLATHAKGKRTVLMIDEAQNLTRDVLEQIRLLTNLETSKTKLLQIILVGQPELQQLLSQPELRQLNQRITARYHLAPLSYSETQKYIKHRLSVSGGNSHIFNHRAVKQVYRLSKGVPRLINIICDRALLGAYVNDTQTVTAKIVKRSAKEVFNPYQRKKHIFNKILFAVCVMLAVFILIYPDVTERSDQLKSILPDIVKEPVKTLDSSQQPAKIENVDAKKLDYKSFVSQQTQYIDEVIPGLAALWQIKLAKGDSCMALEKTGLQCFFDKAGWTDLLSLNRPVIMELSVSETDKRYVLFVGLKDGKVILKSKDMETFAAEPEQVLSMWQGYYLILWQPPVQGVTEVLLGQTSEAVIWIRKHINSDWNDSLITASSTVYDQALKGKVVKFQQAHHLKTDGIVGPITFIHLKNNDPQHKSPRLMVDN